MQSRPQVAKGLCLVSQLIIGVSHRRHLQLMPVLLLVHCYFNFLFFFGRVELWPAEEMDLLAHSKTLCGETGVEEGSGERVLVFLC